MSSSARVFGILVPNANQVVLFRRGPSRATLQLTWDLTTDELVLGQWIKGKVFTRRCDVSPDGRYLIAAVSDYSRGRMKHRIEKQRGEEVTDFWTAISRPPYFTALALWIDDGAYQGGGIWFGNSALGLNLTTTARESKPPRLALKLESLALPGSEDEPLFSLLMIKRGWTVAGAPDWILKRPDLQEWWPTADKLVRERFPELTVAPTEGEGPGTWVKPLRSGKLRRLVQDHEDQWQLLNATNEVLFQPSWIEADADGTPIWAQEGKLYRWRSFPDGEPQMICDLNPMTFEAVPPPESALKW